jgi:hypothetical protein
MDETRHAGLDVEILRGQYSHSRGRLSHTSIAAMMSLEKRSDRRHGKQGLRPLQPKPDAERLIKSKNAAMRFGAEQHVS